MIVREYNLNKWEAGLKVIAEIVVNRTISNNYFGSNPFIYVSTEVLYKHDFSYNAFDISLATAAFV